MRIGPGEDPTEVTARQIRDLVDRLRRTGQVRAEDPSMLIVLDAGYDIVRLTWLLADLPVMLLGRLRTDRVMHARPGRRRGPTAGRQPRHGTEFRFTDPATHHPADQELTSTNLRVGSVHVRAWPQLHPKLERRWSWAGHVGVLPIVEATVVGVTVQRLPGDRAPKPLWLWLGHPDLSATDLDLDLVWRSYLRRFDLEHTFRFFKQVLGFTRPRVRTPEQADRWAWLIVTAYTQLRLARALVDDLRQPWQKPLSSNRITPGRVRRGFRRIRRAAGNPANPPKATRPGPGRPAGRTSTPAPRHPPGNKQHQKRVPTPRATAKTP
jgi:hypothetical protein